MRNKASLLISVLSFTFILLSAIDVWAQQYDALPRGKVDKDTKVTILSVERKKEWVINEFYKFDADEGKEFVLIRLEVQCPKGQKKLLLERASTILIDLEGKEYQSYARTHEPGCWADKPNKILVPFEVPLGIKPRTLKIEDVSINLENDGKKKDSN